MNVNDGIELRLGIWLATVLLAWSASAADAPAPSRDRLHAMNYVVVSPEGPDDGGDFGPHTPGTKTSGIQEAFDCAKANRKDVYIAGGTMPDAFKNGVVYHTQETIRVPWFQDFHLDGGEYVINYDKNEGDAVVLDSLMSCHLKFGLIVAPTSGAVLRLKPETKGPDGFAVLNTTSIEVNALVGGGSVFPDGKKAPQGVGLFLDASKGPILNNTIRVTELIACQTGLLLSCGPSGTAIVDNQFNIPFLHLCSVHMQVGNENEPVLRNTFQVNIDSNGLADTVGVRIFGKRNCFTLDVGPTGKDQGIVFESSAEDNLITALELANGYTNRAARPNNTIVPLKPLGFAIETPPIAASGAPVVNRTPFDTEALIVKPGLVTAWTLTDAQGIAQAFSGPLTAGQAISLAPGDAVLFEYSQAPEWRWRAR